MNLREFVLFGPGGRSFFVRGDDADFHCQFGLVRKEDLRSANGGDVLRTNTGKEMVFCPASFADSYARIRRGPQIIPLKDLGYLISVAGIGKESVVVDAGTGSGAAAFLLANVAGKVFSYELREDFFRIADANLRRLGMGNVFLKNRSVYDGIDERDVDLVLLDLPEPWKAVAAAADALRFGGFLVAYAPTTPQVSDFVSAVAGSGRFVVVKVVELIEREWEAGGRKVRPKSASIGHSGFMVFARRLR